MSHLVNAEIRDLYFRAHGAYGSDSEIAKWYFETVDKDEAIKQKGGDTDYYRIPENATMVQDLIEYKNMNFSQGNILKAIYRCQDKHHSDYERELNKIIWFAKRELARIKTL